MSSDLSVMKTTHHNRGEGDELTMNETRYMEIRKMFAPALESRDTNRKMQAVHELLLFAEELLRPSNSERWRRSDVAYASKIGSKDEAKKVLHEFEQRLSEEVQEGRKLRLVLIRR